MHDRLQLFQAMSVLLSDPPPNWRVNGILFHGRSFGGDEGLFELAGELVTGVSSNAVVINGDEEGAGYKPGTFGWPGAKDYQPRLEKQGCKVYKSKPAPRTLEEGFCFSEFAQEEGWGRVIVIAQPFQLPRIMLTHLHVMKKRQYQMQIYPMAPKRVNWEKLCNGSQAADPVSLFDQISGELDRILEYQRQGNLASTSELIEYLLRGRGPDGP